MANENIPHEKEKTLSPKHERGQEVPTSVDEEHMLKFFNEFANALTPSDTKKIRISSLETLKPKK